MKTEIRIEAGKLIREIYDHGGSRIWIDRNDGGRDLQADTYDQPISDLVFGAIKQHYVGDESESVELRAENENLKRKIVSLEEMAKAFFNAVLEAKGIGK